jgi:uncharacterized protein YchJ
VGLTVLSSETQGDQGWVKFIAELQQDGHKTEMSEHSQFAQIDGQWLYIAAVVP